MHVLKPSEIAKRKKQQEAKKRKKRLFGFFAFSLLAVGLASGAWYLFGDKSQDISSVSSTELVSNLDNDSPQVLSAPKYTSRELAEFSGIAFRDLYRALHFPNVQPIAEAPKITGNAEADEIILNLAKTRGFMLTATPVYPIQTLEDEYFLEGTEDNLIQPLAKEDWLALKSAAESENIELYALSGYRSIDRQRELFLERLYGQGVTAEQIANGLGADIINDTLSLTAVPGFSRHHTGYTIDLYCGDNVAFGDSICNDWITKNNYENAKKYGWIPSYPPDAGEQGPEPEPWEFVWVGRETLLAR